MCYKTEEHKAIAIKLSEKMSDVPRFISNYFMRYKSEESKLTYWGYIKNLLQWLIDNHIIVADTISNISPDDLNIVQSVDITNYLTELKQGINGAANTFSSIGTKKNVFGAFWTYMTNEKIVENNVVKYISKSLFKSETTDYEVKVPTKIQLKSFIENLQKGNGNEFDCIRNLTIVQLMLGSGIRSEELIGLDIDDLYLDTESPYITVLGKGKKEIKDEVLISSKAKEYLEKYLIKRNEFIAERNITNEPALFLSNYNKRISKTPITKFFKQYSNGEINPHMLRHWVGTEIYRKTHDIVLVQRQLRHKKVETAARYYIHVDKKNISSVMAKL